MCVSGVCDAACLNRYTAQDCTRQNCHVGPACTNRLFENPMYPATTVFRTEELGHGLRAAETIQCNTCIVEYVGDVMTTSLYRQRRRVSDEGIYVFQVTKDYVIDARRAGNHARFINHSCSPNSMVVKRVCRGFTRLLIVAKQRIAEGEEITIDYKLTMPSDSPFNFVCKCMTPDCKGII